MEYTAIVTKIKVRIHPNADRIQIGTVCNEDVIVGLDVKDGDLGLYFAPDGQLSEEFANANNLVGYTDPVTGEKKGGYFSHQRRVRAQKFRGVNSYGFWIPLSSLDNVEGVSSSLVSEGDQINRLNGVPICNKYVTPATKNTLCGKQKVLRRENVRLAKHFDTLHFKKYVSGIPEGVVFYLTEKLHGTSGRTGLVLDDTTSKISLWNAFINGLLGRGFIRSVRKTEWKVITGTRNTLLDEATASIFYGEELFRRNIEDVFKDKLKKGEIVYYEIVGYTTTGKSIMPNVEITDKEMRKKYGKIMSYKYACEANQCELYVYRITNVNEDGYAVDLTWPMVMERCKELGIKHVPNLYKSIPTVYDGDVEGLLAVVDSYTSGESLIDPSHIREGVVLRIESLHGTKAFKNKSHDFLMLEGKAKDKDSYIDMEESS